MSVTIDENIALKREDFGSDYQAHVSRDVVGAGGGLAWSPLDHGAGQVKRNTRLLFALRQSLRIDGAP